MGFYSTRAWREARAEVLERDGYTCSVAEHDTEPCQGGLHVHHNPPLRDASDPLNLANLFVVCARHHVKWERLTRSLAS